MSNKPKLGKSPMKLALDTSCNNDDITTTKKNATPKKRTKTGHDAGVNEERGVVYVKHIPHGFFEPQMREYFKQFGHVTRLRLSRSKKTGRSKGYAFVEFSSSTVAKIAAKSMEDYLMFRQRLMCRYMEPSELHPNTFKGADRKFRKPKGNILARDRHNRPQTTERLATSAERLKRRTLNKLAAFAATGIDYDLPGVATKDEIARIAAERKVSTQQDTQKQSYKNTTPADSIPEPIAKKNKAQSSTTTKPTTKKRRLV